MLCFIVKNIENMASLMCTHTGKNLARIFIIGFISFLAVLVTPPGALANVPDLYGFGPRAPAMGNAYSALAEGFNAVYYNPAGLSRISTVDAGVGLLFTTHSFDPLNDVALGFQPGDSDELLFGDIRFDRGDSFGLWGGFGLSISRRVSAGFGLFLPSNRYLAVLKSQSQREPHYLRFEDRPNRLSIFTAVSLELPWNISIGAGANVLFGPEGDIRLYVNPLAESQADLTLIFRPRVAPIVGIQYTPVPPLRIGATYHGELSHGDLDISLDGRMDLGFLSLPIIGQVSSMIFFAPQQVCVGVAYDPITPLTLALEVSWKDWSRFSDASLEITALEEGGTLGSIELPAVAMQLEKVFPPDFHDTFVFKFGCEYRSRPFCPVSSLGELDLAYRCGYTFEPTPVPGQTGVTNFLDQDRHVISLGLGLRARDPFRLGKAIRLDFSFQLHLLEEEKVEKEKAFCDLDGDGFEETPVLGYPGYEVSGEVIGLGITAGIDF